MNFLTGNVAENWTKWYQKFHNFLIAMEKIEKPDETKITILLNLLGDEGASIFNAFKFDENVNRKIFNSVIKKFEEHCVPCKNVVFERYNFFYLYPIRRAKCGHLLNTTEDFSPIL